MSQNYGLTSHNTHVVCVNFICEWRDLHSLMSSPNNRFLSNFFKAGLAMFNRCEQNCVQHGSITIAIDCNGNYASGPKSTQWLVLGALAFQYMSAGFLCPKYDNFSCLYTHQDQNELHLKRWFFLPPSASSVNRLQAHLAERKRIGWSIGFNSWSNWTLYGVILRSLYKIRLKDVSEMFNCWERRWIDVDGAWHTHYATAAIFSVVHNVLAFHPLLYRWGC